MSTYTDLSTKVFLPVTLYKTLTGGFAFSIDERPAFFYPFVTGLSGKGAYYAPSHLSNKFERVATGHTVYYAYAGNSEPAMDDFMLFIAGRYIMLLFARGYDDDVRSRVFESDPTAEEIALAIYHLYPNADYFDFVVGSLYPEQLATLKTYVQLKVLS